VDVLRLFFVFIIIYSC